MNVRNRNRLDALSIKKAAGEKLTKAQEQRLNDLKVEFRASLSDRETDDDRFLKKFVTKYGKYAKKTTTK